MIYMNLVFEITLAVCLEKLRLIPVSFHRVMIELIDADDASFYVVSEYGTH